MSEKEFLSLLRNHQSIIYKLVHIYARDKEEKKDLYQEIVLQAWKTYPQFRGDAKFSTWLYRLCLNTIFTIQRKLNKIEYTDTSIFEDSVYTAPQSNEDADRLYKAMKQLTETDRAIVALHLDGYENQEISSLIGISSNNVGVKLFRAKQLLASFLKDNK